MEEDHGAGAFVGWTLLGGLLLSIGVMLVGLIWSGLTSQSQTSHVLPLDEIGDHLRNGDPAAILALGILILFATPVVGVAAACVAFIRVRDTPFIAISIGVIGILAVGFALALR